MIIKPKVSDFIEKELEQDIIDGKFKVGDFLPSERDLMERFGVGRPSIREAIYALKKKGLIDAGSGRRTRVIEYNLSHLFSELGSAVSHAINNADTFRDILDFRRFCEVNLIKAVVDTITDNEIEQLREILAKNKASQDDLNAFWQSDSEFHSFIANVSGNAFISRLVSGLLDWLIHCRHITLADHECVRLSYQQHEAIFKAIEARDSDQAVQAIQAHLDFVEARFR